MSLPLPEPQLNEIRAALYRGQKIDAIKLHREYTGSGLAEAKSAVEKLDAELRESSPEKFPAPKAGKGCFGVAIVACAAVLASLLVSLLGCSSDGAKKTGDWPDAPALCIIQLPDYPPGRQRASKFQFALVAALWRDGRMIRNANAAVLGESYVVGQVEPAELKQFFTFLKNSRAVKTPQNSRLPLHVAGQYIRFRDQGKVSTWTWELLDTPSPWSEVRFRLFSLSLKHPHPLEEEQISQWRWYANLYQ